MSSTKKITQPMPNDAVQPLAKTLTEEEIACVSQGKPCCTCAAHHKTKVRQSEEMQKLKNRLKRMEGQLRGIQNMIDTDAYCTDVLMQVSAVQAGLKAFNRELLENHIRTCVVTEIQNGDDAVVTDLVNTIHKLMK